MIEGIRPVSTGTGKCEGYPHLPVPGTYSCVWLTEQQKPARTTMCSSNCLVTCLPSPPCCVPELTQRSRWIIYYNYMASSSATMVVYQHCTARLRPVSR